MSVHAAVPEVVWCPANIIEMNMPVTSSAQNRSEPSGFLIDMSTSSRSRSSSSAGGGSTARRSMIPWTSSTRPDPGRVAPVEALDVGVGVDVGDGVGALFEVVVEPANRWSSSSRNRLPMRQADDV